MGVWNPNFFALRWVSVKQWDFGVMVLIQGRRGSLARGVSINVWWLQDQVA